MRVTEEWLRDYQARLAAFNGPGPLPLAEPAKAPRQHIEDDLQASVADALEQIVLPPAEWTAFPAGHIPLPMWAAAKLSRAGMKRSWPDFLVQHGSMHGIELKTADGDLSITRTVKTRSTGRLRVVEGQREVFDRLRAGGMKIAVCRSIDEVVAALRLWGIPLRCR